MPEVAFDEAERVKTVGWRTVTVTGAEELAKNNALPTNNATSE